MDETPSREALFEILSCYFARSLWANQYEQALDALHKGTFKTLEDAYRSGVGNYLRHIRLGRNPQGQGSFFDLVFNELYAQYKRYIAPTATPTQFVEICCAHFCPRESVQGLGANDRRLREVIRTLLTKTLVKFAGWILGEQLAAVLSPKRGSSRETDQLAFRVWKQQYTLTLQAEINTMCACIIAESNGVKAEQIGQAAVSKEVMDKAQLTIRRLVEDKAALTKERNELTRLASELHSVVDRLTIEKQILENRLLTLSVPRQAPKAPAQPLYVVPSTMPVVAAPLMPPAPPAAPPPPAVPPAAPLEPLEEADLEAMFGAEEEAFPESTLPADDP